MQGGLSWSELFLSRPVWTSIEQPLRAAGCVGHNRAMNLCEKTLATPALNLALDEGLLDWAEATEDTAGVLRLWEPESPFVVLGRVVAPVGGS